MAGYVGPCIYKAWCKGCRLFASLCRTCPAAMMECTVLFTLVLHAGYTSILEARQWRAIQEGTVQGLPTWDHFRILMQGKGIKLPSATAPFLFCGKHNCQYACVRVSLGTGPGTGLCRSRAVGLLSSCLHTTEGGTLYQIVQTNRLRDHNIQVRFRIIPHAIHL